MANETVNFTSATSVPVGDNPYSVAVADFNKDGSADLAVANYDDSNVSVVLGNGKGSFSGGNIFAVGINPFTIVSADFNGDGSSDLATSGYRDGKISILLGNGTGGFGIATDVAVGAKLIDVAVGDFNRDGKADLAIADDSTNLAVLLGDGTGSFGAVTKFAAGTTPISVTVGDVNGDKIVDLIAANSDSSNLSVLLGDGKGSFGAVTNVAVGNIPAIAAVGDFNRDGIPDLATANFKVNNIGVLLGNGAGGFGAATNFAVGTKPFSLSVTDFNDDGIVDLATTNNLSDNVSVLLGKGDGSFATVNNFAVGNNPGFATFGNFNGDNLADVVSANRGSKDVSVLLNSTVVIPEVKLPAVVTPEIKLPVVEEVAPPVVVVPEIKPPVVLSPETVIPTTTTEATLPVEAMPEVDAPEILFKEDLVELIILMDNTSEITDQTPVENEPEIAFNLVDKIVSGITLENNLFKTDFTAKGFGIRAVSQKATNKVNEIGIFAVDDTSGKIGSIAPGTPAYPKAALDRSQPIFTSLGGNFFNTSNQEVSIDPTKIYQFFEIEDGSIAEVRQQIADGKTPTNLLFSTPDVSGNSSIKVTNSSNNDGYTVSVNNDELVLEVVSLSGATVNSPIGSNSQSAPEGRTIDLTKFVGQALKTDITTTSSAAYSNNIGFYVVEDSIGTIKLANGSFVKPGDANYAIEAIKNALTNSLQAGKTDSKIDVSIVGGKIYAPVVIAQGTLASFAANNPTNSSAGNVHAFFNYVGANSDKIDHFRLIGANTFGVEDILGGGDRDFNDLVVNIKISSQLIVDNQVFLRGIQIPDLDAHILYSYYYCHNPRVPMKGTPTQLTCRGAPHGYPRSTLFTNTQRIA